MRSYCAVPSLGTVRAKPCTAAPRGGRAEGTNRKGFCERSASRQGPGVADWTVPTDRPPETNDR